ncbi:MAG: hydantoinase/oxoprolinase family protein [Thermodesulfobacteriota bacterium]|nr:hydantoinase/oxoprolinase family protein [Thermodesulfobacteriota bacterium]
MKQNEYIIGIDTGGTFTDITIIDEKGEVTNNKALSTPRDFSVGIMNAVNEGAASMGINRDQLLSRSVVVNHGMTVATNTLINRSGAKTGLITTKGFEDTILIMKARGKCLGLPEIEIKHQARCKKPEPIVPKELIKGVTERIDCFGKVVVTLNVKEVENAIKDLVEWKGVEAVAICTLWSHANPSHEMEIERIVEKMYPELAVTRSSRIVPLVGEYERMVTTVFNAYLMPETKGYLDNLHNSLKEERLKSPLMIMQAHGGVATVERAKEAPVFTVGSGPTGGVIAGLMWGKELGYKNIITTDVGGTSFDVGVIVEEEPLRRDDAIINQYQLRLPMVDVVSIGAGGGSIAWFDSITNTIKVGPQSAGADPGPACYDLGGKKPCLADSDIILGFLNPDNFLGGRMKLNREKAISAMGELADNLNMDVVEAARGVRDIACSQMADLIQNQVLFKGYNPRDFVMFLFGGAGPEFGAEYGSLAGVREMVMLYNASTFSAFGIAGSDILYVQNISELHHMPCDPQEINDSLLAIEKKIIEELEMEGFRKDAVVVSREAQLRYGRQVNYVDIPIKNGKLTSSDINRMADNFEARYEALYGKGSGHKASGIEMVNLRVYANISIQNPRLAKFSKGSSSPSAAFDAEREVYFKDRFLKTKIYTWENLMPGNIIEGPACIESRLTTGVILPEMKGSVDEYLNIHLTF